MTDNELNIFNILLKKETNLENLLKIKEMVEHQINDVSSLSKEQIQVLSRNLHEFYEELKTKTPNSQLPSINLYVAVNSFYKDIYSHDLRVYHLVKVGGEKLAKRRGVGKKTITTIEDELNRYDLSLYKPISDVQIKMLSK